jgi:hypothetical protein
MLPRVSNRVGLLRVVVVVAAVDAVVVCVLESRVVLAVCGGDFAMGSDRPRSFPRLATPTPQVKVVLYPEHSFPISMHCPQYGRRRSHLTPRFLHAKQSSLAPVAGALLLRFLGAADALLVVAAAAVCSGFWASTAWVAADDMFMDESNSGWNLLQMFAMQVCKVVGCYVGAVKRINKGEGNLLIEARRCATVGII